MSCFTNKDSANPVVPITRLAATHLGVREGLPGGILIETDGHHRLLVATAMTDLALGHLVQDNRLMLAHGVAVTL